MAMYRRGKGTGPTDSLSMKASVDVMKVLEELATRNGAVVCQSVARCQGTLLNMWWLEQFDSMILVCIHGIHIPLLQHKVCLPS